MTFRKIAVDIELLPSLAYHKNQTDECFRDILWKAIDGEPWALHGQRKDGIEFVSARAV